MHAARKSGPPTTNSHCRRRMRARRGAGTRMHAASSLPSLFSICPLSELSWQNAMEAALSPSPAPPVLPTVHAEAAPSVLALHNGEHNVSVTLEDDTAPVVVVRAVNQRSGDSFELALNAEAIVALLPPGFPAGAASPATFYRFLLDAFAQEAGTVAVDSGGARLRCVSREDDGEDATTTASIALDIGWLASIIGRGGSNLADIEERSGARVIIDKPHARDETGIPASDINGRMPTRRGAQLSGTTVQVRAAAAAIRDVLLREGHDDIMGRTGLQNDLSNWPKADDATVFVADITLTQNPDSYLAQPLPVKLTLPLKTKGSPEAQQWNKMQVLRAELVQQMETQRAELTQELQAQKAALQGQIRAQQQQLKLMKLQINQRVFFGVNHSVHMCCTKLTMSAIQGMRVKTVTRTGSMIQPSGGECPQRCTCTPSSDGVHEANFRSPGAPPYLPLIPPCRTLSQNYLTFQTRIERPRSSINNFDERDLRKDYGGWQLPAADLKMQLQDVASASGVSKDLASISKQLHAAETDWIMPLPSVELMPLQLCQELTSFTVSNECGQLITDLRFLENLPKLVELELNRPHIRDIALLATLPSLVCFLLNLSHSLVLR